MAMTTQLSFLLSFLLSVSSTESSDVYAVVGGSVQLDTQERGPHYTEFSWMFNKTNNVVKYFKSFDQTKISPAYKHRVEFNNVTLSLTLKNLKNTDSGLYELKASDDERTQTVTEYRLSVLDPVQTPELTRQQNNETCNITLTCRGSNLSINSSCYKESCEETSDTSAGGITLSLSVKGSSIICNQSNKVSWKEAVLQMEILKHCHDKGKPEPILFYQSPAFISLTILVTVLVLIILIATYIYVYKKKSKGSPTCDTTVYAEVEGKPAVMLEAPTTVYHTVGECRSEFNNESIPATEDKHPEAPVNTYDEVPDKREPVMPETIYATVSKPSKV